MRRTIYIYSLIAALILVAACILVSEFLAERFLWLGGALLTLFTGALHAAALPEQKNRPRRNQGTPNTRAPREDVNQPEPVTDTAQATRPRRSRW